VFLSQTAEYAIRAMSAIATLPPGSLVCASDLGESTGIPPSYLSKILRRLVLAELLVSQKGKNGGFALSRPPERIQFIEILYAINAFPAEGRCAFGWGLCEELKPCPLHGPWRRLKDRVRDWADNTTLAEVAEAAKSDPRVQIPTPSTGNS
jgi:Rrf2 family protein